MYPRDIIVQSEMIDITTSVCIINELMEWRVRIFKHYVILSKNLGNKSARMALRHLTFREKLGRDFAKYSIK